MLDERRDESVSDETAERIAENEVRFRSVNERIEGAAERLGANELSLPLVCECGRLECLTAIRATMRQYESVRANPRHFMCAEGHAIVGAGIGRVIREEPGFVVVEKLGIAAEVAEENDPRTGRQGRMR